MLRRSIFYSLSQLQQFSHCRHYKNAVTTSPVLFSARAYSTSHSKLFNRSKGNIKTEKKYGSSSDKDTINTTNQKYYQTENQQQTMQEQQQQQQQNNAMQENIDKKKLFIVEADQDDPSRFISSKEFSMDTIVNEINDAILFDDLYKSDRVVDYVSLRYPTEKHELVQRLFNHFSFAGYDHNYLSEDDYGAETESDPATLASNQIKDYPVTQNRQLKDPKIIPRWDPISQSGVSPVNTATDVSNQDQTSEEIPGENDYHESV